MEVNKERIIELAKQPEVLKKALAVFTLLGELAEDDEEALAIYSVIGVTIKDSIKQLNGKLV